MKTKTHESEEEIIEQLIEKAMAYGATMDEDEVLATVDSLVKQGRMLKDKVDGESFIKPSGMGAFSFGEGMTKEEIGKTLEEIFVLMTTGGGISIQDETKIHEYRIRDGKLTKKDYNIMAQANAIEVAKLFSGDDFIQVISTDNEQYVTDKVSPETISDIQNKFVLKGAKISGVLDVTINRQPVFLKFTSKSLRVFERLF